MPLELLVRTEFDLETGKVRDRRSRADAGGVMDPRLLQYYNLELQHLREMGAEFAAAVPEDCRPARHAAASRSPIPTSSGCSKASAFLAARVQLKLDAEFPRFTQALLEIVYPHYLAPTPSMLVAQLQPDPNDPNLAGGTRTVPRGTHAARPARPPTMRRRASSAPRTTSTLWPIEIASASYFSFAPDLPLNALPIAQRIKGGLRIRLKTTAGLKFAQTTHRSAAVSI